MTQIYRAIVKARLVDARRRRERIEERYRVRPLEVKRDPLDPGYARNNIIVRVRRVRTRMHKYIYSIYNVREQHKYVRRGVIGRNRKGERRREVGEVTQSRMRFEIACAIEEKRLVRRQADRKIRSIETRRASLLIVLTFPSFYIRDIRSESERSAIRSLARDGPFRSGDDAAARL